MIEEKFNNCLLFTSDRLNKITTKIAEDEFKRITLTPTYAYILLEVKHNSGVTQDELSEGLHLAPLAVKKLLANLVKNKLITIEIKEKLSHIYLTEAGEEIQKDIEKAILNLNEKYEKLLGEGNCNTLVRLTNTGAKLLESSK